MKKVRLLIVVGALVLTLACLSLAYAKQSSVTLPKGTKVKKIAPGHFMFKLPNGQVVEVKNFNPQTGAVSSVRISKPGLDGKPVAAGENGTFIKGRQLSVKEAAALKPENFIMIDDEVTWLPATLSYQAIGLIDPDPPMRSLGDPDPPPRSFGDPDPPLRSFGDPDPPGRR